MMSQLLRPEITVIIPAYNEENVVASQIEEVQRILTKDNIVHEIIVVDDGSTDNTAQMARQTGAKIIIHPVNRGYGASIKTGISAAENNIIVILDADKTYPADQIPPMLDMLEQSDMVVGARIGEDVHIPWIRRPAKTILRLLAQRIAEQKIPDLNSGLRIFRSECVKQYFPILSDRFSFTTTVTLAYMADNYRVVYHPINYYSRIGKSKIVPWHFMDFFILIIRMSMMFNPLKVFVPLAFSSGLLGILKILYDIWAVYIRNPGGGWNSLITTCTFNFSLTPFICWTSVYDDWNGR